MNKDKQIPEIRFKGFTDTWSQYKLKELVKYRRGSFPQPYEKEEWYGGKNAMPFVQVADVSDDLKLKPITKQTISKLAMPFSVYIPKNSVIVTLQGTIGRVAVTQYDAYLDRTLLFFDSYLVKNIDKYFWALLIKNKFEEEQKKAPGAIIKTITKEVLSDFEINIAPSDEQLKIGSFFKHLDDFIILQKDQYEKLNNFKNFLLEKMLPKKGVNIPEIRFKSFTDEWQQYSLFEVANYRNGKAHENDIINRGKYIVINSKFVSTNGEIRKFSNKQNEPMQKDEIAFVLSDIPSGRALAKTFLVPESEKYTLNQRIAGITPHENINARFLAISMNRNKYFLQFDDGVKQTNLAIKDMEKYENYYPDKLEQDQIGLLFEKVDNLIIFQKKKIEKLYNIKKSLLKKMFI